jgi:hypothetical protein
MKDINVPIPKGKLQQFDEILKACGGRYLSNPRRCPDQWGEYRVDYEYANIEASIEHERRWRKVTEDLKERVRTPWWRKLLSFANTESDHS